jgi:hypothetical protein
MACRTSKRCTLFLRPLMSFSFYLDQYDAAFFRALAYHLCLYLLSITTSFASIFAQSKRLAMPSINFTVSFFNSLSFDIQPFPLSGYGMLVEVGNFNFQTSDVEPVNRVIVKSVKVTEFDSTEIDYLIKRFL